MTQSNFLNRWARKKAGVTEESVKDGSQQTAPGLVDKALQPDPALTPAPDDLTKPSETPQALTLEDVEKIDVKAADFSAFMRADVDPVVQQAIPSLRMPKRIQIRKGMRNSRQIAKRP